MGTPSDNIKTVISRLQEFPPWRVDQELRRIHDHPDTLWATREAVISIAARLAGVNVPEFSAPHWAQVQLTLAERLLFRMQDRRDLH